MPEIINTKVIAKSHIFEIESVDLNFKNGQKRIFERFQTQGFQNGAVMIVPINADNELLLIREYAVGIERYELGFPKGIIDSGETAEQAVLRELQEEVGVGAKQLQRLKTLAISPGYMRNTLQIFLARDLFDNALEGDEPEPLEVVKWPLTEYKKLLLQEDFPGALSIAALSLAREVI